MDKDKQKAGKIGGARRAEVVPADRRAEIARAGAFARWGLKATHRGNFKEEFGIDVDCYVLDDPQKTAVISQRGMGVALGMGVSGTRLPNFVNSKRMADSVGQELREKLQNPLVFQPPWAGGNSPPPSKVNGYDVTILIDLCKAVVSVEAEGRKINPSVVRQAHVVLNASAKAGIKGLVYALAGYDATREETIAAFKFYVRDEARDYEREFPNQLYQEWYRLYQLPAPEQGKTWKFKHLTVDQVYRPLAHSSGRILELTRAHRASSGERRKKLHQFLSEVGVKALRQHLGQLLGIAQVSRDKAEYEGHVKRIFDAQLEMDL
ncbi:MAG: P63C domain-containing protein [Xanthobacteraceae bacterium]